MLFASIFSFRTTQSSFHR